MLCLSAGYVRTMLKIQILWLCCAFTMAESRKCYSCMTKYYGQMWEFFGYERMYLPPKGFTDHCIDPTDSSGTDVGTIECDAYSNCITIVEEIKQGVGNKGYIRGCFNSIFKWGFNRSSEGGRLQYREFCRQYNLSSLIQGEKPHNSKVVACSCRGHLCNSALTNNSASAEHFFVTTLLSALALYSVIGASTLRLLI